MCKLAEMIAQQNIEASRVTQQEIDFITDQIKAMGPYIESLERIVWTDAQREAHRKCWRGNESV